MSEIDFINDFQMSWQHDAQSAYWPSFYSFRQEGMVCIGARFCGYRPGLLPTQTLLIEENSHELRQGKWRMCVVQLNRYLVREGVEIMSDHFATAEFWRFESSDYVL